MMCLPVPNLPAKEHSGQIFLDSIGNYINLFNLKLC